MRAPCCALLVGYNSSDQIKKNEMGGTCATYGAEERSTQGFGEET